MPLSIRDGNSSLTTLSTIVVSSAHIPAHTVVSLGSQAITDISSSVSGLNNAVGLDGATPASNRFIKIGGHQDGQNQTEHIAHVSSGGALKVDASDSTVTFGSILGTVTVGNSVTIGSLPAISGTVTANVPNLPISQQGDDSTIWQLQVGGRDVSGLVYAIPLSDGGLSSIISGTVTANVGNNLTDFGEGLAAGFSSAGGIAVVAADQGNGGTLAISGTVTANSNLLAYAEQTFQRVGGYSIGSGDDARVSLEVNGPAGVGLPLVSGVPAVPISGTVTANIGNSSAASAGFVKICGEVAGGAPSDPKEIITDSQGMLYARIAPSNSLTSDPVKYDPVLGDAYINVRQFTGTAVTIGNSVTIASFATSVTARLIDALGNTLTYGATGSAGTPSPDVISVQGISGGTAVSVSISSVTIGAVPNGSLTTRFGSVTTANTAQISSAVTNATRRYLLIQNVTTSSNVITVGIGFTPTTTQGIQLTAGGGITFESSYIPTGAVYVLSSVTASPFTILEA